jgi:hypothetical protein
MSRRGNAETEFRKTPYEVLKFKFHVVTEAIQGWPHERIAIVPQGCLSSFLKQEYGCGLKPLTPPIIARCRITLKPSC